ncbi:MAG: hypothetical protein HGA23_03180 [Bacteroidales bacterium]|nr:hypothetical protein [Bacteroidales bacterium]
MNKFRFNIKNSLLYYKFWTGYKSNKIEYPAILEQQEKTYGKPFMTDHFNNLENWNVKDKNEWGSAVPGNLCTFARENVMVQTNDDGNSLVISTTPVQATGKGWNGEDIIKPISSGLVTSKFLVKPGQAISATVNNSNSYTGSWFAFWLMKRDVPGDERYREIDIFVKFMKRDDQKQYSVSIHGGTRNAREILNFGYPMFFVDEKNMTFTCELFQHSVKIYLNGIQLCQADEPDFEGEYHVVFNDGPSTHDGKVKQAEIMRCLPRTFEVIDFRVYNL